MIGLLTSMVLAFSMHAHHTSVCDITYNEQNETIEIVQRVFVEDLEHALIESSDVQVNLYSDDNTAVSVHLERYIGEQLSISSDDTDYPQTWIGYKIEGAFLKMFIEVPVGRPNEIKIGNRLFLRTHHGQENVIHFTMNDVTLTQVCTKQQMEVVFKME
ncbi:MAG: hypothetical protein QNK23_08800 [Crocinitomicaceae bacterium]|nr:hypothetical protein [Crocinitomicaceae bacterium]